jgi:hypothetical protein
MGNFLDSLNHPLLFILFLGMALWGFAACATYIAKETNNPGLAMLVQHP